MWHSCAGQSLLLITLLTVKSLISSKSSHSLDTTCQFENVTSNDSDNVKQCTYFAGGIEINEAFEFTKRPEEGNR